MQRNYLRAPDFTGGPWFNSEPLTMKKLAGKVLLVDFWTYSCVNCLRTLPYLKGWHSRYSNDGLVIIGVHSPEFDFERDPANLAAFIERNEIEYPVVMDNDFAVWSSFANRYWPHHYFIDAHGYIRHDHAGEGGYSQTELWIQRLLSEARPGLDYPRFTEITEESVEGAVCYPQSAEVYASLTRGELGNAEPLKGAGEYHDTGARRDGRFYLEGSWEETAEFTRHTRTTRDPQDYVAIAYRGLEANAVLGPAQSDACPRVYVTRDGHPLPQSARGADILEDEDGSSYIDVDLPRMYRLVEESHYGVHELKLSTDSDQLNIYAFTFGGCSAPSIAQAEQRKIA